MLRITKGITIASMVAVFVLAPVMSAQAITGENISATTQCVELPPAEPRVNPAPPTKSSFVTPESTLSTELDEELPQDVEIDTLDARDPSQDAYAQGNAPIGGGPNADSGPGQFMELCPEPMIVSTTVVYSINYFDIALSVSVLIIAIAVSVLASWTLISEIKQTRSRRPL